MNAYAQLQQRLDETLFRMEKETAKAAPYGLFAGKTGAAFCCFQLAGLYRGLENKSTGRRLAEEVLAALPALKDITLAAGLAGIGWGLEAMNQNGYAMPDTARALDYIDDEIYKYATFRKTADLTLDNGLLGSLVYLTFRLDTVADSPFRHRSLLLQECITLLISDLEAAVSKADKLTKGRCLVFFQQLREKGWYPEHAKQLLRSLKGQIEQAYACAGPEVLANDDLYLLKAYAWLAVQTRTESMRTQADAWEKGFRRKRQADGKENAPVVYQEEILPLWPAFSRTIPAGKAKILLTDCYLFT